jgi:hypothetical protein
MAELADTNPHLADILSRTDPDGSIAKIIEAAAEANSIIGDATYLQCNDGSKHKHVIRTGIPEPAFRSYNQGVQPSKSTTVPVVDTCGMITDYSEVDKELADLSGNSKAFRASDVIAKMQGFNNFVAENMIYGNTATTPEGFLGLAPRYSDPTAASGRQMVTGGGSGSDNTSVWYVTWGGQGCNLLYPKNSPVGFQHRDLGEDTKDTGSGALMQVYRDYMSWNIGFALGDWRANARVCNIDVSNLTADAASGADLLDLMIDAEELLDTSATMGVNMDGELVTGRTMIYVGRTVAKFLRKQALNKSNVELRVDEVAGKRCTMWGEYAVKRIDAITDAEATISGF